jgi:hypothetical protein
VRVSLEATTVREIPILALAPDDAARGPVVVFIPGFGGAKEVGLSIYSAGHTVTPDMERAAATWFGEHLV